MKTRLQRIRRLSYRHPILFWIPVMLLPPMVVFLAVSISTVLLTWPVSFLLGLL